MRLTLYSDYAFRVLIYLALRGPDLSTIQEIAEAYGISENHLMKVVHQLGRAGWVETARGPGGGLRLKTSPQEIRLGLVVSFTEDDFRLVESFDAARSSCRITPACRLQGILSEAKSAFLGVLNGFALADLVEEPDQLMRILHSPAPPGDPVGAPAP